MTNLLGSLQSSSAGGGYLSSLRDVSAIRHDSARTARFANRLKASGSGNHKNDKDDKALKDACRQWESMMMKMMYKSMKKTIKESSLINGGQAEKIFDDMLTTEYADNFSKSDSVGIADLLYEDLTSQKYNPDDSFSQNLHNAAPLKNRAVSAYENAVRQEKKPTPRVR